MKTLLPVLVLLAIAGCAETQSQIADAREASDEAREAICSKAFAIPTATKAHDLCRRGAALSRCAAALEEALAE